MKKILLVLFLLVIAGCTSDSYNNNYNSNNFCNVDEDCVAATCCHPYEAVNKKYAPNCDDSICTLSCEGPLDCGAGRIECENNKCVIKKNE